MKRWNLLKPSKEIYSNINTKSLANSSLLKNTFKNFSLFWSYPPTLSVPLPCHLPHPPKFVSFKEQTNKQNCHFKLVLQIHSWVCGYQLEHGWFGPLTTPLTETDATSSSSYHLSIAPQLEVGLLVCLSMLGFLSSLSSLQSCPCCHNCYV